MSDTSENSQKVVEGTRIEADWFMQTYEEYEDEPDEYDFAERLSAFLTEKGGKFKEFHEPNIDTAAVAAKAMYDSLVDEPLKCPHEVAMDLVVLALYDVVVLVDDSTTMRAKQKGARMKAMMDTLREVCKVVEHTETGSIKSVRFLNAKRGKANVKSEADIAKVNEMAAWNGVSKIGMELKAKFLDRMVFDKTEVRDLKKPLLIIVITDGEVECERKSLLPAILKKAYQVLDEKSDMGKYTVSVQFAYVGNDPDARELLLRIRKTTQLDNVSCLLGRNLENITEADKRWSVLPSLLLGSILQKWKDPTLLIDADGNIECPAYFDDEAYLSDE